MVVRRDRCREPSKVPVGSPDGREGEKGEQDSRWWRHQRYIIATLAKLRIKFGIRRHLGMDCK
jgi:hypothetical protein